MEVVMMVVLRNSILFIIVLLSVTGCALFGKNMEYQPFDSSQLDKLIPGTTTAQEISGTFGAPSEVVKLSNGNAYIYQRAIAKGTGVWLILVSFGNYEKQYDRLVFFFDTNDILSHYGVSLNAGDASYGFPF
jgi:hypothetical protein